MENKQIKIGDILKRLSIAEITTVLCLISLALFVPVLKNDIAETASKTLDDSSCYDSFEWLGKTYVKKNVENEELLEPDIKLSFVTCMNGKLELATDDVYPNIIVHDAIVTSALNDAIINATLYSPIDD